MNESLDDADRKNGKEVQQDEECGPVKFPFPFPPYPIQEDFMKNLYQALDGGKIGIFESPTGTVRLAVWPSLTLGRATTTSIGYTSVAVADPGFGNRGGEKKI